MPATTRLVHVTGIETISEVLKGLPREMRARILATAVEEGAKPLVASAKQHLRRSVRTGALYMSVGKRVKEYEHTASAVAIVGPQRGYFRGREQVKKGESAQGAESPSHYAHLIEFGHHIAKGGSLRPQYNLVLTQTGAVSKNGKPIKRWKRGTIKAAAKGEKAGWVAARPFMRPAFMKTKGAVATALVRSISKGVERVRRESVKAGAHAA